MIIHVSTSSGVPIYLQIEQQIEQMISVGRLGPSEELPPIRSLAQQLVINPNTVARAYRDLEQKGLLSSKQGSGTFVAESAPRLSEAERLALLGGGMDELVALSQQLSVEPDEVMKMLEERLRPLRPANSDNLRSPFDDEFID